MNLLDTRTVLFSYIVSDAICAAVMTSLWLQNRRRSPGLGFWLTDFLLQMTALLLIALRGLVPDFVSILLGNFLVIGGTLLLYMGLEHYTGQASSQRHNYLLLTAFIAVHAYFTFVQPSLPARNINLSLALLVICSQCAWLMLRRVLPEMRPHTQLVGVIFGAYSLISLVRIVVDWAGPQGNDLFQSGLFDTLIILVFQMLFISLTFGLFLMVNRRLLTELETTIRQRLAVEVDLRASEERYRTVADYTFDWEYWLGPEGQVLYMSPSCERVTGYRRDEFVADPALLESIVWPADQRIFEQHKLSAALASQPDSLHQADFRIQRRDGHVRWISHACQIIRRADGTELGRRATDRDVTERKQAEEQIVASEVRYRRLFEAAKDGILILDAETGLIVDVNPFLIELLGLSSNEFRQKRIWELGLFKDIVANQAKFLELRQKDYLRIEDLPLETAGGRQISVEFVINVYPVDRHKVIQCNIRDITERKHAEAALRASEAKLRAILDATPFPIALVDLQDNNIAFWSRSALALFGQTAPTAVEWYRIAYPDLDYRREAVARWKLFLEKARRSAQAVNMGEYQVTCQNGSIRHCELYAAYQADHLIVTFNDVTERKRAEEANQAYAEKLEEMVDARTRELREAQAQLVRREKLAVLGQMSGGVAHELRQPLAVMSNAVYFLQAAQPNADATTKEYLGFIAAELQTAERIITDLLSFASPYATTKESCRLADLVEQVLARNPAPAGVTVQIALSPDLPNVHIDPRQIGQVLNNLITNAYQAMPRGGQLTLTADPSVSGYVTLALVDTGDGISPENLPKLFEPLFTTKPKGIGLGLTVTQMLVEANGGAIEVLSETGHGATFQFTLPLKGKPV